jgi:hypothetical protein
MRAIITELKHRETAVDKAKSIIFSSEIEIKLGDIAI